MTKISRAEPIFSSKFRIFHQKRHVNVVYIHVLCVRERPFKLWTSKIYSYNMMRYMYTKGAKRSIFHFNNLPQTLLIHIDIKPSLGSFYCLGQMEWYFRVSLRKMATLFSAITHWYIHPLFCCLPLQFTWLFFLWNSFLYLDMADNLEFSSIVHVRTVLVLFQPYLNREN